MVKYRKYLNFSSELSFAVGVHVEMAGDVWEEWEYCLHANVRTSGHAVAVKQSPYSPGQAPSVQGI